MALALVKYKNLFYLVSGYLYGAKAACHDGCMTVSSPMSIAVMELCHSKRGVPTFVCQLES
jgi:hypothetical protein